MGTFIADYIGEVLLESDAEERGIEHGDEYLFTLDFWSKRFCNEHFDALGMNETLWELPPEQDMDATVMTAEDASQYLDAELVSLLDNKGAVKRALEVGRQLREDPRRYLEKQRLQQLHLAEAKDEQLSGKEAKEQHKHSKQSLNSAKNAKLKRSASGGRVAGGLKAGSSRSSNSSSSSPRGSKRPACDEVGEAAAKSMLSMLKQHYAAQAQQQLELCGDCHDGMNGRMMGGGSSSGSSSGSKSSTGCCTSSGVNGGSTSKSGGGSGGGGDCGTIKPWADWRVVARQRMMDAACSAIEDRVSMEKEEHHLTFVLDAKLVVIRECGLNNNNNNNIDTNFPHHLELKLLSLLVLAILC